MLDWEDLRFVLAVVRAGSALGAARALRVNQTTVSRRIARLEASIGAKLFETRRDGQAATALGEAVAAGAARVEAEILALESAISERRRVVSGTVRFTSSELFANWTIAPFLRRFRQRYPAVGVELISDDRRLDLARGEADVAVRAGSRPDGGGIVAQRLPDVAWGAYCSKAYREEHGVPGDIAALSDHAIVGLDGAMAQIPQFLWLMRNVARPRVSASCNSLTNLVSAVKAGLGIGVLPCFVANREPDLIACLPQLTEREEFASELWLVLREDLKQAPHIRAFADCLAAHLGAMRGEFAGGKSSHEPGGNVLAALMLAAMAELGNFIAGAAWPAGL